MATSSANVTRIMLAMEESTISGYPHASISSGGAFEWTIQKFVRSNVSSFELLILHVPHAQFYCSEDIDKIYTSPECFQSMVFRDWERGVHLLEYFVTRSNQIGAWIKLGDPKTVICREAKRIQPDLLVLGSRALSPAYLTIDISVSEYCLKHAECPVIDQAPESILATSGVELVLFWAKYHVDAFDV
ncbi:hypothetical protein V6N12_019569 [Hibiscus sabdariffa]|uniref:UspA domain-containing protein n=1 Tax=Hibiscus sabdariffa TaxID=183260 RepID=A0ABR2AFP8_9ROSI